MPGFLNYTDDLRTDHTSLFNLQKNKTKLRLRLTIYTSCLLNLILGHKIGKFNNILFFPKCT